MTATEIASALRAKAQTARHSLKVAEANDLERLASAVDALAGKAKGSIAEKLEGIARQMAAREIDALLAAEISLCARQLEALPSEAKGVNEFAVLLRAANVARTRDWNESREYAKREIAEAIEALASAQTGETKVAISLTLTKHANDIHCALTDDSLVWDCGETPLEAIGRWVVTHGKERGISVEHTYVERVKP